LLEQAMQLTPRNVRLSRDTIGGQPGLVEPIAHELNDYVNIDSRPALQGTRLTSCLKMAA